MNYYGATGSIHSLVAWFMKTLASLVESVFGRNEPSVLFLFKLLAPFCCLFVCLFSLEIVLGFFVGFFFFYTEAYYYYYRYFSNHCICFMLNM